mgnify:CR=1 FL=1
MMHLRLGMCHFRDACTMQRPDDPNCKEVVVSDQAGAAVEPCTLFQICLFQVVHPAVCTGKGSDRFGDMQAQESFF